MPTFTEEKKKQVRESLRNTGYELFAQYGIRKTTISELTEAAGIGTGTFYQYYDSKEELYVDILEEYNKELIPRLLQNSVEAYDDPEMAIAALLEETLDEFESNPLLKQIIIEDEVSYIRNQISAEEISERRNSTIEVFLPYIEHWYDEGKVVGTDPESIAHSIRAVARIAHQKEQIGEERYPKVRDTLIAAVAAGLTRDSDVTEKSDD
ncbi:TetR/AcrR family transcriptional regulator [Haladaptatus pallidirubidus]|uniref:TetR family transcriptional regulator C-terminal domain-containing protein n=1 Tax=Haladaptatus pallidirubidus TaxID=1008152 RepID=A0AAV3URQ1_9EURY|nr:TetR/AcrR family transcriptional regulator [Haladaptatus pallidirubidus]